MSRLATLSILVRMAMRSLLSHRVKNLIVGSIMLFGTALVVVGTSLLDSVERSMSESIISSLAGHLQLMSADARDDLQLFGGMSMGDLDVGSIEDFAEITRALESVENISDVVPMGIRMATVGSATEVDKTLSQLRKAAHAKDSAGVEASKARLRRLVTLMRDEKKRAMALAKDKARPEAQLRSLERALREELWVGFMDDPEPALHFLDSEVAELGGEGKLIYLRYLGTDLERFAESFDRFQIVEGQQVPAGEPGVLLNRKYMDRYVKVRVAILLDDLHTGRTRQGLTIAGDPALRSKGRQIASQAGSVLMRLDPQGADDLRAALQKALGSEETDLETLLDGILAVDDGNFDERYAFFYDEIAPRIALYPFWIGDTITLRAPTRRGYIKALNVKIHGVFAFKGLEGSDLSGAVNLVDLRTFRDLYGQMTDAQRDELKSIQTEVGAKQLDRASAEDALFGGGGDGGSALGQELVEGEFGVDVASGEDAPQVPPISAAERESGLVLNAAITLKDPTLIGETTAAVEAAVEKAGLNLKVVDWQQASGIVGQFVIVVRIVLFVAIFIIFGVALVIINNSMVMATMERVTEIGTLRAIGAQRGFVLAMFLLETLVLGLLAGAVGAAAGAAIVGWLGDVGLPATTDVMVFLFSGPRLHPTFDGSNLSFALSVILAVSIISTLYPARIATRIEPVVAMQASEA